YSRTALRALSPFPTRRSSDLKLIPLEELAKEQMFLEQYHQVLPKPPQKQIYAVHKDNKVSYKGNFYSVPIGTYNAGITKVHLSRSEEHTSELQSRENIVCRLL